jgi:hypothetical protein
VELSGPPPLAAPGYVRCASRARDGDNAPTTLTLDPGASLPSFSHKKRRRSVGWVFPCWAVWCARSATGVLSRRAVPSRLFERANQICWRCSARSDMGIVFERAIRVRCVAVRALRHDTELRCVAIGQIRRPARSIRAPGASLAWFRPEGSGSVGVCAGVGRIAATIASCCAQPRSLSTAGAKRATAGKARRKRAQIVRSRRRCDVTRDERIHTVDTDD